MAKGFKTGGRNFPKGVSGNPAGGKPIPQDLKVARKLNKIELERIINECMHMPITELKTLSDSETHPAIEVIIAKIIYEGKVRGDEKRLGFILDRLTNVGPVKQKMSLDGGADGSPVSISLSSEIADEIEKLEDSQSPDDKQFE